MLRMLCMEGVNGLRSQSVTSNVVASKSTENEYVS